MIRSILAVSLAAAMFGFLGGGASEAGTRCQKVASVGLVCLTTPPHGIEVFRATDGSFTRVHGVGLECFNGHYYLQYQLGGSDTYRPVPLFDLGRKCKVFS